jgi:hypothetical protein
LEEGKDLSQVSDDELAERLGTMTDDAHTALSKNDHGRKQPFVSIDSLAMEANIDGVLSKSGSQCK